MHRLRAWWDAPLFSMPHRSNEQQIPMFTHRDCPPNTMYMLDTMTHMLDDSEFVGWF